MASRTDVIVIGGGVIGCAVAYYLAKAGVTSCVLEKGAIGGEASRAAAGLLAPLAEGYREATACQLSVESLALFPSLAQDLLHSTGIDVELVPSGILRLAISEAQAEEMKQQQARSSDAGSLEPCWLTSSQVAEMEPGLTHSIHGGLLSPLESHLNGLRLTEAFARAAANRGARFMQGVEVTGFLRQGMRITGVRAGDELMEADHVVIASGAWSGLLGLSLGLHIPVRPVKGQMLALQPTPSTSVPQHIVYHGGTYLATKRDGSLWVGATQEEAGFNQQVTAEGTAGLLTAAIQVVPDLREATLLRVWSGLRPGSPDGMPILGPVGELEGLVLATGHFRNGILLSPITGRLIADYIGSGDLAPLRPFSFDRPGAPGPSTSTAG